MNKEIVFWSSWWLIEWIRNIFIEILKWISLQIRLRPSWRKKNRHNTTWIKNINWFDNLSKITVGNYTYWPLDCKLWTYKNSYIKIGNYCWIAEWVKFLCGFGHNIRKFCHHPIIYFWTVKKKLNFAKYEENKFFDLEWEGEKWPIIIDDDVWIWTWAIILSWVHIWQWAVIGAGAVVTKNIPPYAIAGWVPAKVVKYRFSEEIINELLKINYENIPIEVFREIYKETINENFNPKDLVNKINFTLHNM